MSPNSKSGLTAIQYVLYDMDDVWQYIGAHPLSLCIVNNTGSQFPATWFHKTPISLITCGGIRKHWLQKLTYKQSQACSIFIKSDQASNKIQLQLTFVSLSSTFIYRI